MSQAYKDAKDTLLSMWKFFRIVPARASFLVFYFSDWWQSAVELIGEIVIGFYYKPPIGAVRHRQNPFSII